jgi:hypothetical protein
MGVKYTKYDLAMKPIRGVLIACCGFVCVALSSCSQTSETSAVCSRAPELESSLVAVDIAIASMSDVSARQLQSMFAVLLSSLDAIGDVAPVDLVDQFSQVERSYHSVSIALQNVYWEGSIGVSDAAVLASIDDLSRNDNVEALEAVRSFVTDSCQIELQSGVNKTPGDAVNLPAPTLDVEPNPDLNTGFDNEVSALQSYAYFVAERFEQALTPEQALCVGTLLTNDSLEKGALSDAQFDALVVKAFDECKVNSVATATTGG